MIRSPSIRVLAALLFATLPWAGLHATETTAELQLEKGYVDPQSGVKVEEITSDEVAGTQEIHLAVPRSSGPIDEVIVMGRRPESKSLVEVLQSVPHQFVSDYDHDYDHDYYGLVIYLGHKETLPIRVYMNSAQHDPGAITP